MRTSTHPFCFTEPVSPSGGRLAVPDPNVSRIVNDLVARQCCLVIGPPASGTSSVLLMVRDTYREKFPKSVWWDIDLDQLSARDVASFYGALAADGATRFPTEAAIWSAVVDEETFLQALTSGVALAWQPVVLAIDHIEEAPMPVARTIVRVVRSLYARPDEAGASQRFVSVVMAGSRRLRRHGEGRGSPLNFARVRYVQDLEIEAAVQMLLAAGEGQPWCFDPAAAEYLAKTTGGDKYLLQRLGHDCVEQLYELACQSVSLELAQEITSRFVQVGFRDDPTLGKLLPSLLRDENALEVILALLEGAAIHGVLAQKLSAEIASDISGALKLEKSPVLIRNEIYRQILCDHRLLLEAASDTHRNAQQRITRAYGLQRLISRAELALVGERALPVLLGEIRGFLRADELHLFRLDETQCKLVLDGTTSGRAVSRAAPALAHQGLIAALHDAAAPVRCGAIMERCTPEVCLGNPSGECVWVPLLERRASRLVGALALASPFMVPEPRREKELMELSGTLADNLERWRYLQGFQQLARIRVDLPPAEMQRRICEVASFLFNQPFAFLWQGAVDWPPIPLRAGVGVTADKFEALGLTPRGSLCLRQDHPGPKTLLVELGGGPDPPLAYEVMWRVGLSRLFLVCFAMQDNQVGILGIGASDVWQPTDIEETLAQLVARQATVILDNLNAYHRIQQRLEADRLAVPLLSHELNRIPAAIAEELELLLEGHAEPVTRDQRLTLKRVQGYVEGHQKLLQQLLEVTRLDARTFRARMSPQPLRPVLDATLNRLAAEVERAGMQLAIDLPAQLPMHRLDPVLVERILDNLARNAIQYAGQDTLYVRARTADGKTKIEVEDQGPGVPAEFQELIFEPWHRGPHSGHIAGHSDNLGLGLHFVRRLMELHGGRATYDPGYAGGARFVLIFPKLEGEHRDDPARGVDD